MVITRRPLTDDRTLEARASRDATDNDARYRYHYYLTPRHGATAACQGALFAELARVIKAGAGMESSCKRGKGEVGMDEYQVRTWQGWHHHMALSLMAIWFLIGETHRGQQLTPALTLPQVRYGLSLLLLEVYCTPGVDYICRQVQRQLQRNESARYYHLAPVSAYHHVSYAETYSRFIHGTIEIVPLAFDFDIRFVQAPAEPHRPLAAMERLFELWAVDIIGFNQS